MAARTRASDLGVHPLDKVFLGHTKLQALDPVIERGRVIRHRQVERGGIERIVAGNGLQHEGGILHRVGERSDLVERGGKSNQTKARDASVARLQPDTATKGRRLADGTAGIRAERGQRFIRRHHRGGTSARAARNTLRIARVARDADRGIFGGGAHGEFVHVGAAERNGSRGAQLGDDRGIIGRDVALENLRRASAGFTLDIDHIFDCHRNAAERQSDVDLFSQGAGPLVIAGKVTADGRIGFFDRGLDCVKQLHGGQFAGLDQAAGLGDGQSGEMHHPSTTLGTRKSPLPECGALAVACAWVKPSRGRSARKTL
jgi:hypothetical protein